MQVEHRVALETLRSREATALAHLAWARENQDTARRALAEATAKVVAAEADAAKYSEARQRMEEQR